MGYVVGRKVAFYCCPMGELVVVAEEEEKEEKKGPWGARVILYCFTFYPRTKALLLLLFKRVWLVGGRGEHKQIGGRSLRRV